MAPKCIKYENTYFYQLMCKDITVHDIYVGHTTNFNSRKYNHKATCNDDTNKNHNAIVYKYIRENGGWDNWDMILISKCSCENSLEAKRIERKYIEQLEASLNYMTPGRTRKERYAENKVQEWERRKNNENYKEYIKIYRETNKAQLSEKKKYIRRGQPREENSIMKITEPRS